MHDRVPDDHSVNDLLWHCSNLRTEVGREKIDGLNELALLDILSGRILIRKGDAANYVLSICNLRIREAYDALKINVTIPGVGPNSMSIRTLLSSLPVFVFISTSANRVSAQNQTGAALRRTIRRLRHPRAGIAMTATEAWSTNLTCGPMPST